VQNLHKGIVVNMVIFGLRKAWLVQRWLGREAINLTMLALWNSAVPLLPFSSEKYQDS